jgi:DNA-binding GntR family transcriptional regulator
MGIEGRDHKPRSVLMPPSGDALRRPLPRVASRGGGERGADPFGRLQKVELRSAEQEVYETLRYEIVHGLPSGTPLPLAELSARFGISTMPIRAAIARLESDHLVTRRPRRGSIVSELTAEDFIDIYAIRMALEGVAARFGSSNLRDGDIEQMREVYNAMSRVHADSHSDVVDLYLPLTSKLHDICYQRCTRPRLLNLIHTHRRNAERYFRLYLGNHLDYADDLERQKAFLSACKDRDPARAEAVTRDLFERTSERLLPELAELSPAHSTTQGQS